MLHVNAPLSPLLSKAVLWMRPWDRTPTPVSAGILVRSPPRASSVLLRGPFHEVSQLFGQLLPKCLIKIELPHGNVRLNERLNTHPLFPMDTDAVIKRLPKIREATLLT